MKYTLYKDLLDDKNILSHVFFDCANDFIQEISDGNKNKSRDEIEKRKIDIQLKIDGHICNPKYFFDTLFNQYSSQVERRAIELVKERTSKKFNEISDKLEEYRRITEEWADTINWDITNPLNK